MNIENNNIIGGYEKNKNDIILKENGRIFPLWIMENFKKYLLPEIVRKEGEDPCKETLKLELTKYQQFLGDFLNYRSPFKDVLVYHGLGSGKTVSVINIYNILYNYTPKWNVFILLPAALEKDPWMKDIKVWLEKDNYEDRLKNLIFVHYDSPFADREFLDKIKIADSSKPFLFVIDEVHRFITNVYNNVTSKKGKRAQIIYDYIQQEKQENSNNRILLLSATPGVNSPFEFALLFNLLRPGSFPTNESIFEQLYISSLNFSSLNENNKNMFQRRILGLVSYYLGATPDKYAVRVVHYKNIIMGKYQEEIYNHFEEIEEQKEKLRIKMSRGKVGGDDMSTYNVYTRQACNFVFPTIPGVISGELRPRPGNFKIYKKEEENENETNEEIKKKTKLKQKNELEKYQKASKNYINEFISYIKNIKSKTTLDDDINLFINKYKNSLSKFLKEEKNKSEIFNELYKYSPKIITVIFNILKSKGPVLVYSNFVEMEGLQMLKIYLNFFGFIGLDKNLDNNKYDNKRYAEYHGGIEIDQREINKKIFNDVENKYGKLAKIFMISSAGSAGINLYNVRQVHILEPYFNEIIIEQVIGRAIRQCHHADLPQEERKVDVFRYKMVRKNNKETSDEKLENISRKKYNLLLSFLEAMKEAAIDCNLFKAHNMMGNKYDCFQFNQESLFEIPIGPAYNEKIEYDQKINNGLNSKDSKKIKIRVRKINAVKKLSEKIYSEILPFWYDDKTTIVYDYELYYPIGKIDLDESGNIIKLDNNVYIIGKTISIPSFKLY